MTRGTTVGYDFVALERGRQAAFFAAHMPASAISDTAAYRLLRDYRQLNLAPSIRDVAARHFADKGIAWHLYVDHGLSSQVACLNFLMPLATRPDILAQIVQRALGGVLPEMLEVEPGPDGQPWFVGFEWIGGRNYLGEWPRAGLPQRGANVTSADAFLRFRHEGRTEALLIEWKYTESYGKPPDPKSHDERMRRYGARTFAPGGPFLPAAEAFDVADLFWEPTYQLARQQMLAWQMERDPDEPAERVRVLHIAPSANLALRKVTSPALRRLGSDILALFPSLISEPDSFISRSTETLFAPLIDARPDDGWAAYLSGRYAFLKDSAVSTEEAA